MINSQSRVIRCQVCCRAIVSLVLLLRLAFLAVASVELPALISNNMVLQSSMKFPIWGTAAPFERVSVALGDQKLDVIADVEGNWMVKLEPMEAGGPLEMTIAGINTITLQNVMVGEVWVCSGQSNMQWPVSRALNPEQEIAEANYPMIRLFSVKRVVSDEPLEDTEAEWVECSPETVGGFSAVGYFFGRKLHKDMNTPVGLIHTSWGGTPAEAWTSMPTLVADPQFEPILGRWEQLMAGYPQAQQKFEERLMQWKQQAQKAEEEEMPVPRRPRGPIGPEHPHKPAGLYNGMIAPLIPYGIKGAIWYQGEANAGRAYQYRKLFPVMISDWRRAWGQGPFPFLFVQLANFTGAPPPPEDSAWAELREAQTMTLMLPKTGMAVTIDIGESYDIHPRNKQDVGHRLALTASGIVYNQDVVYSGPTYDYMKIEEGKIRIHWRNIGSGLVAKDNEEGDLSVKGFAIAGPNCKFAWAKAEIDGDTVLVWNDWIRNPIAVRYAWADDPECNLYNAEGLPASPFRTDRWPGVTAETAMIRK